jgi:hypothetical protein
LHVFRIITRYQEEICCPLYDQGYRVVVNQMGVLRFLRGNSFNFSRAQREKAEKCRLGKQEGKRMWLASHHTLPFQAS